jgi:hypothetical protein
MQLTPTLEKLILCGKASFKTFTAGGAQKSRLSVDGDRFIIILGFTHFPYSPNEETVIADWRRKLVTQMNVFSDKSFNSFVFRNEINLGLAIEGGVLATEFTTGSPVSIDTYLIHENDVSFSFSLGTDLGTTVNAVAPNKAPAKIPPTDYGREGLPTPIGNIPVSRKRDYFGTTGELRPFGDLDTPTAGKSSSTKQLQYPVEAGVTAFTDDDVSAIWAFPIVLVQYVEIQGNPSDIQASN